VFWVFKSSDTFGKNVMVEVAKNLQVIATDWSNRVSFACCIACACVFSSHASLPAKTREIYDACLSQAPIKLLFPKNFNPADEGKNFSMLGSNRLLAPSSTHTQSQFHACSGLGDIVIPGIFLALLLRFDAIHKTRT
jgi:hypothetical protein